MDSETARERLDEWLAGSGERPQLTVPWLARLDPLTYDQYRARVADLAGVRLETLDREVEQHRQTVLEPPPTDAPDPQDLLEPAEHFYRACNICGNKGPIRVRKKVSTTGWIVFAILLLTTCVFCWVGLLITEERRYCSHCNARYLLSE